MNFESISLSEKTKKSLLQVGYHQLTSVQLKVIPLALEGKDIIAQSQTGTGKTAAFLIPIFEKLEPISKPQVLILVPTRELALQVSEEAKKLSAHNRLRVLAVYGGDPIHKQLKLFRQGVDIVVGTPGRVMDHIFDRGTFPVNDLKIVILDEVDEMIGKGFLKDIEKIMKKLPQNRQTLLFSATVPPQMESFTRRYLKDPVKVVGKIEALDEKKIEHFYLETTPRGKSHALSDFLHLNRSQLVIIFANTKRKVEQIYESLREDLKVDYIHSGLSQSRRIKVFNKFREKKILLLIATDVAARGLDIKNISYVINYDFPQTDDFYTHRVGRTGRAGASGKALTFISSSKEKGQLLGIARQREFKVERFANRAE